MSTISRWEFVTSTPHTWSNYRCNNTGKSSGCGTMFLLEDEEKATCELHKATVPFFFNALSLGE